VVVPSALLSHESTEHYTPQYILDAVITCMGAIDPDSGQHQLRDPQMCRQRDIIPLRFMDSCSLGSGGASSIHRSAPVSSDGFQSYTRSGHRQGFLDRYGPWFTLVVSVTMILVIMIFIFFRCNEIFAMGPAYDCAVGKGWYGVMGIFAITATVSLLMLCRGKRGE